jgi:hypothetical protein
VLATLDDHQQQRLGLEMLDDSGLLRSSRATPGGLEQPEWELAIRGGCGLLANPLATLYDSYHLQMALAIHGGFRYSL